MSTVVKLNETETGKTSRSYTDTICLHRKHEQLLISKIFTKNQAQFSSASDITEISYHNLTTKCFEAVQVKLFFLMEIM